MWGSCTPRFLALALPDPHFPPYFHVLVPCVGVRGELGEGHASQSQTGWHRGVEGTPSPHPHPPGLLPEVTVAEEAPALAPEVLPEEEMELEPEPSLPPEMTPPPSAPPGGSVETLELGLGLGGCLRDGQ